MVPYSPNFDLSWISEVASAAKERFFDEGKNDAYRECEDNYLEYS